MRRQGIEQFDIGDGEPRMPEQGYARWQIRRRLAQASTDLVVSNMRGNRVDPRHQRAPQRRLPRQIRFRRVTVEPGDQQLRTLTRIGREQPRKAPGHRVAAALAQLTFLAGLERPEVRGQRDGPGLVQVLVDHRQQRPHQRSG
ncbi:Uncharacterised protein [Mycobacteroides abscessus subsp. abscessus]|nr:Uncharacterised protein [Mycobacteroides abscessus subsp. abscessus]